MVRDQDKVLSQRWCTRILYQGCRAMGMTHTLEGHNPSWRNSAMTESVSLEPRRHSCRRPRPPRSRASFCPSTKETARRVRRNQDTEQREARHGYAAGRWGRGGYDATMAAVSGGMTVASEAFFATVEADAT